MRLESVPEPKASEAIFRLILVGFLPAAALTITFCVVRARDMRCQNRQKLHIVRDRLAGETERWIQANRPGRNLDTLIKRDLQARAAFEQMLPGRNGLGSSVKCLLVGKGGELLGASIRSRSELLARKISAARKGTSRCEPVDFSFEDEDGKGFQAFYRPILQSEGGVLIQQSFSEIRQGTHRMLFEALLLLGAVSAGLVGLAFLLGGSFKTASPAPGAENPEAPATAGASGAQSSAGLYISHRLQRLVPEEVDQESCQ